MTVQIDTTAENNGLRLVKQGTHPSTPSAGHVLMYFVTGTASPGLFVKDDQGNQVGPLITGTASSASSSDYIKIADYETVGTNGGTFTNGAWQTRVLNTEVADAGGHASLSSNQITLAAGTYDFRVICPAYYVDTHQAKLYNVTDAADVELGMNASAGRDINGAVTTSVVSGRFTISGSKVFEVQHRCTTTQTTVGFGIACSFGTEVYTVAEFWKVA